MRASICVLCPGWADTRYLNLHGVRAHDVTWATMTFDVVDAIVGGRLRP